MKVELNINGLDIISDDLLEDLRGGTAEVISADREQSKEGDGANWVCCIKIELPQK